jgi:type III restriction enzyme
MSDRFFEQPILNSPYAYPDQHWQLDSAGQPTLEIVQKRRTCAYTTPVPKSKNTVAEQTELQMEAEGGITVDGQAYDPRSIINEVRAAVDTWRKIPDSKNWGVTPETARLLTHWRTHDFSNRRPFFCQVEAAETAIWLTEVAPKQGQYRKFGKYLEAANAQANPQLFRLALKLATGAGKTTVMAMIIAWQTINAVRHPGSKIFSKGFLIVAPGITIRDRLRVLMPNDTENYYESFEMLPRDLLPEIHKAKIVITNYHAFQLREKMPLSKGGRDLLQGRGPEIRTKETEGQMVQRVVGDLMGMKNILVINDEAHHCYREKVASDDDFTDDKGNPLSGPELAEAKKQASKENGYARIWINGIEAIKRTIGLRTVFDLSATPFFLAGSGYREGTLFPWVMSDFSLMDAIECGIVKLPRVPIADNIPDSENQMPKLRVLWEELKKVKPKLPQGNRKSKASTSDPLALPALLETALEALYGHYEKTFKEWQNSGITRPPVFIVVCQNTAISELVYHYISGFEHEENKDGPTESPWCGKFDLFRNYNEQTSQRLAQPRTLLIDSEALESGEALTADFRKQYAPEIERFRKEEIRRTGNSEAGKKLSDAEILREVMNTVGEPGKLGGEIRCVVSVSMLTEGWDANTVTHILGIRAFGTQLLCEQVVGRGLRRQSYELNEDGLFDVEYADVLGIPFDFTAKPVVAKPKPPKPTVRIKAVRPERDHLEISFPRVLGYRTEQPGKRLLANFGEDHDFELTPAKVGPTHTIISGIIGKTEDLTVDHLKTVRDSSILFRLTNRLIERHYRDENGELQLHLFGQLKRIVREWLDNHLVLKGDCEKAQILGSSTSAEACNIIQSAILDGREEESQIVALLDPFTPTGSSRFVNFNSSKPLFETDPRKSHLNYVVKDSEWEGEFARVIENYPGVISYVKNQGMQFTVPYLTRAEPREYHPDFIVLLDDGHGPEDPLNLVVEIKGFRGQDAKDKARTMKTYWVPGVNDLQQFGRWGFLEITEPFTMEDDLSKYITKALDESLATNET